jgi:hypothetical protein
MRWRSGYPRIEVSETVAGEVRRVYLEEVPVRVEINTHQDDG